MSSTASRSFDTKQNSGSNQNSDSGQNSGGQNISKNAAANAGANEVSEIREDFQTLLGDVGSSVSTFCKNRPQLAALMIFTLGFYVGWKIKPW
jgi:hypothetical protein